MDIISKYKQLIAKRLGDANQQSIFLYWKGRVALFALLKAMKVGEGDEVILPGFTCVVVPNAIKYTGAKPVYVDVDPTTMIASLENYQRAVTDRTKVLIVQNTFGLSAQADLIADFANSIGVYSIEDCAHGFGGYYKGKPNGLYCDAAFFSTQWNKPFSTGIGGFAYVSNHVIKESLISVNKSLLKPSSKDITLLAVLHFVRDNFLNAGNFWVLRSVYRFLSKYKLVVGSSENMELTGVSMPAKFFKGISKYQVKKGINNLLNFDELIQKRYFNALKYNTFLKENKKTSIPEDNYPDHSFLKFPVLVKNRKAFELAARKEKIELGDWFCSPLYPVLKNWKIWGLDSEKIPNALFLSEHIVNFPTETNDPEKVIKFAQRHVDEII